MSPTRDDACTDMPGDFDGYECSYWNPICEEESNRKPSDIFDAFTGISIAEACCSCIVNNVYDDPVFASLKDAVANASNTSTTPTVIRITEPLVTFHETLIIKNGQSIILEGNPDLFPVLDAKEKRRHFFVTREGLLALRYLKLHNGRVDEMGGGCVHNQGLLLDVRDCEFQNCKAFGTIATTYTPLGEAGAIFFQDNTILIQEDLK